MRRLFLAVVLFFLPVTAAHAEWREASSDHFVIYADQRESDVRDFAEKLERYHSAMHYLLRGSDEKIAPSNRVTIFVVDNVREVKELLGDTKSDIAGFYQSRAGGSFAIIPRLERQRGKEQDFSETVLLHEYAHHYMYGASAYTPPLWYSEGFAEFYASASFERDGSVWVGRPAQHRAYELLAMREVPLTLLLDTAAYTSQQRKRYDSFYGRSWLLYHYLVIGSQSEDSQRKGQLSAYLKLLANGTDAIPAAQQAFGDLGRLDKDMDGYLRQSRISAIKLSPDKLSTGGPISVRELSEGASDMMRVVIRSRKGVNREQALELLPEARKIAAQFPGDSFVQAALAEAEYDAGNTDPAIAAADRALAADPQNIRALIQKFYALARIAGESGADGDWDGVRRTVVQANRIDHDNPIPLIYYYQSFLGEGKQPSDLAIQGLERALQLAPYDKTLRMMVAVQNITEKRYAAARDILRPLLLDPHNSGIADAAAALIDTIPDGQDGADGPKAADQGDPPQTESATGTEP